MKNKVIKKEFQILSCIKGREEVKKRLADSFPMVDERDCAAYTAYTMLLNELKKTGEIPKEDFAYYTNMIRRNIYTKE